MGDKGLGVTAAIFVAAVRSLFKQASKQASSAGKHTRKHSFGCGEVRCVALHLFCFIVDEWDDDDVAGSRFLLSDFAQAHTHTQKQKQRRSIPQVARVSLLLQLRQSISGQQGHMMAAKNKGGRSFQTTNSQGLFPQKAWSNASVSEESQQRWGAFGRNNSNKNTNNSFPN